MMNKELLWFDLDYKELNNEVDSYLRNELNFDNIKILNSQVTCINTPIDDINEYNTVACRTLLETTYLNKFMYQIAVYDTYIGVHDNTCDYHKIEIKDIDGNFIANEYDLRSSKIKKLHKKMKNIEKCD